MPKGNGDVLRENEIQLFGKKIDPIWHRYKNLERSH